MTTRQFDIYAPLQKFHWDGDSFELSPGLWVKHFEQTPDLRGLDDTLSKEEQKELFFAQHWLTFRWDEGTEPSPGANINLVLLALWLVKPINTLVAHHFNLGLDVAATNSGRSRLLDRFHWIPDVTCHKFDDTDLKLASTYYRALHDFHLNFGRLNDALLLTLSGCWSHQWQVALVCYSAAAETLLTYDKGHGLTKRLSTVYACLVETQPHQRDVAYREFRKHYSIRSDIMHGRTHNVPAIDRLPCLVHFADIMRNLWRVVISSPPLMTALEGKDAQRKKYFKRVCAGYFPPK